MKLGASSTVGYSAAEKEVVKMTKNGPKCVELGVETYGGWGEKVGTEWTRPPVKPE